MIRKAIHNIFTYIEKLQDEVKSQDDFVLGVSWVVQDIGAALDRKEKELRWLHPWTPGGEVEVNIEGLTACTHFIPLCA